MRPALLIALVIVAGFLLHAQAPQADRPDASSFDPQKKDAWRFLDDDLGKVLEAGGAAYEKGDVQLAARHYLAYLFRNGRDGRVIYNLARCYARMGNAEAAVAVLGRAARAGFSHPELLESDEALQSIRDTRVFKSHREQVAALGERLGATIAVIGPRVNRCRVRLPAKRVPGQAYPLVIGLHGNGSCPDDLMTALPADAFPGMICAAPEGLYTRDDLGFRPGDHFTWFLLTPDKKLWRTLDAPTSDSILAVIDEVAKSCPVSTVVLFGHSQGVSAAYLAALRRPDRIAGVVAFAGSFPADEVTPEEIKAGNRIKVFIGHGLEDAQVKVSTSERARDLLRDAGYQVEFRTFEGGHGLPADIVRQAGEWIRKSCL